MKKYTITFTKDYAEYEKKIKKRNWEKGGYYQAVKDNPDKVEFRKK